MNYLNAVVAKYATSLEQKVPEFAQEHEIALDLYIKDAAHWFSSSGDLADKGVNSMYQALKSYKPRLLESVKISGFIVANQNPMIDSLIPYVSKSSGRRYKTTEARLFQIQQLQKNLRLLALEQVIEAEQVLTSMYNYLEFKQSHK